MKCSSDEPTCADCFINCPVEVCECTDKDGNLLIPAPTPPQPDRPIGCPECVFPCPLLPTTCPPPNTECTETQLTSYIRKCPDCIPQAGCQQVTCACKDCSGTVFHPPTNPPQPARAQGCSICPTACDPIPFCPLLRQCTEKQLKTYVPDCPDCIPQAGCQQTGCDCEDCFGDIFTPRSNPPQPPRPEACPKCNTVCLMVGIRCPTPIKCTDEQLENYVPK